MNDQMDIAFDFDDLRWPEETNPLLPGTIGIADAYYAVLCAVTPEWSDLCDKVEQIESKMIGHADRTGNESDQSDYDSALRGIETAQRKAHQRFLQPLETQELTAYVQNPETKESAPLAAAGWKAANPTLLGGILDDYGGTPENPAHPDATIAGIQCPMFFLTDDFETWAAKTFRRTTTDAFSTKQVFRSLRDHKLSATIAAITAVYFSSKPAPQLADYKTRNKHINDYLTAQKLPNVSDQTIRRAWAVLRKRQR
jgi:hypothetical protein